MATNTKGTSGLMAQAHAVFKTIAACAAVFLTAVCIVIVANCFLTQEAAPLTSPVIDVLRAELKAQPGNAEVKEKIRAFDLLARRAYFSSVDFARAGAWMLIGGALVLLVSLGAASKLEKRLPDPGKETGMDEKAFWRNRTAQKVLGATGSAILAACLAISLHVKQFEYPGVAGAPPAGVASNAAPKAADYAARDEMLRNWPTFRGPGGAGVACTSNAPTAWNGTSGQGVVWKTAVPLPGYSSPIVWSNRVFVTGGDATNREVYCFDAGRGVLLWRHLAASVPGSPAQAPAVTEDTGYAAPTAATDGRRVFAMFATGDLLCLDLDGRRLWARNLGVPDNSYGHSSSLITYRNLLLVQFDHRASARLLALDAATGNEAWTALRTDIAWGSPIVVNTGSRDEAILTCSTSVDSYDPLTGKKLWGEKCLSAEVGTSAAYADGLVFVANDYSRGTAIRVSSVAGGAPSVVWSCEDDLPDASSPLAAPQYIFMPGGGGTMTCLGAKTGERMWKQTFSDGFYASPILAGNRVYALDRAGVMHIFDADKTYTARGEAPLGEPAVSTPAFAGGRIFLRGKENLYCVGEKR